MGWTDTLIPASYRGVGFGVFAASKDFGKRVVTHEFPLRDKPFHETMGLSRRAFAVEAFVIGDDMVARVRALEAAIERKGPGRLVHPWYGSLQVEAIRAVTDFAAVEGRVARVQIEFEEAGTKPGPTGLLAAAASLLSSIANAVSPLLGDALSLLNIAGEASFLADAFAADTRAVGVSAASQIGAAGLSGALAALGPTIVPPDGRAMTPALALSRISEFGRNGFETGEEAFALLSGVLRASASAAPAAPLFAGDPDPRVALVAALVRIATIMPVEAVLPSTLPPTRILQARNHAALRLVVAGSAAMAAAEAATVVRWDSRDQLAAHGALVAEALDEAADIAGAAGADEAWRALSLVASAWSQHVAALAPPLPAVRIETPPTTIAASLLAYRLDGDALADLFDRGAAIGRRNRVRHPGFLRGGQALEVVGNG